MKLGNIATHETTLIMTPEKHLEILEAAPADDAAGLRCQLEKCRAALRLQTQRSRQLVAAYTTKLRDKESALRETERRCDTRLATIVRALLALEANLKREQRAIRAQLVEKDKVIAEQRRIIKTLMKPDTCSKSSSTESSPVTSQNSSLNSSSSSHSEIITIKQTLSVFENTINIENTDSINIENTESINIETIDSISSDINGEKENVPSQQYLNITKEKPVKPPKPPKPCTPYKPILKLSLARQPALKKEVKSLPELHQRTKRASSEVCLLLAPARNAPSTHHMHPPAESTETTNNKVVSPHRVSRMVQRFEPRTTGRSLSCNALTSLKLSPHFVSADFNDDHNLEHENMNQSDAELYSLSSNEDKSQLSETSTNNDEKSNQVNNYRNQDKEEYRNLDQLTGNFEEFHLDSESSEENEEDNVKRKDGDGAENLINAQNGNNKVASSYEGFLEATGLSQKSILTPSRLLASSITNNSHRSVLKPRHVKFRSKANRGFTTPTVKYWSGPFL